jgi:diaminopimelate epimerase
MIREIPFTKYHGMGNDWVVAREGDVPGNLPAFSRAILDRHEGAGADGLIVAMRAQTRGNHARIRFFNADGSEAEMSGNGIRCAGAYLDERKPARREFKIETVSGLKTLWKGKSGNGKWTFRVEMGPPILSAPEIPFEPGTAQSPILRYPIKTHRGELPVTVTSMGNPHCSIFVADFDSIDWLRLGREIERGPHFPNRTNVEFIRLISESEIEVRYWERGVGHTKSSGTGSCGATVASILNGLTNRRVRVNTEAGALEVAWPEGGQVILTGPVVKVMSGKYFYASDARSG